jgi:4-hydroxyacetophenone monooxygenase
VTEPIAHVDSDGVTTESGREYEVDILVLATGFDVTHFLTAFEIEGRDGRRLAERWGDDPRAFLGTVVPGLPNFFCLYGPNLQPGHGGSILFSVERQIHYVVGILCQMIEHDVREVEVRDDVVERYHRETDRRLSSMVWMHPGMTTYYRNAAGRIVVNSPYRNTEWWAMTEHPSLAEFHVTTRQEAAP